MKQYRKNPITITAVRWDGENLQDILALAEGAENGGTVTHFGEDNAPSLAVETAEGVMSAKIGDWIIRGVADEIYPCDNEVFELSYEAVDDE